MEPVDKPPEASLHPPQLRLWQILALLFAASVLCGLLAPTLRAWTAQQWTRFGAAIAAGAFSFGSMAWLWQSLRAAADRRQQEAFQRAGPIAFRARLLGLQAFGKRLLPTKTICVCVLLLGCVLLVLLNAEKGLDGSIVWLQLCLLGACLGTSAWMALASLAKPADVYVAQHGLIIEGQFKPWSTIELYRQGDRFLFRWFWFTCVIAAEDESQAQQLAARSERWGSS